MLYFHLFTGKTMADFKTTAVLSLKEKFNSLINPAAWLMGRQLLKEVENDACHCYERGALELIKKGAALEVRDLIFRSTPLLCAAERGHSRIVTALLAAGARHDQKDIFGSTALIYAAKNGHADIVKALITHGAHTDTVNKWGDNALLAATRKGHIKIACALIEAGAALERKDNDCFTALWRACEKGYADIVAALISKSARLDDADHHGKTAHSIALKSGHHEIARMIEQAKKTPSMLEKAPPRNLSPAPANK